MKMRTDACAHLRHFFHYMLSNGLVYLCMAEESFSRRNCFMFLSVSKPLPPSERNSPFMRLAQDVAGRFEATFGERGLSASPFEMNEEFHRVLQSQMVTTTTPRKHLTPF